MMIAPILLFGIVCISWLPLSYSYEGRIDVSSAVENYLHNPQPNNSRHLQAFSTINNIISEITLVLPDAEVSSSGMDITMTDLVCYEANIQDAVVTRTSLSDAVDRLDMDVIGLTITCNFRWYYEWSILSVINGSGSGKAVLDPSSEASISLDIATGRPPRDVSVHDCTSDVQIDDLILDGDGLGAIASVINLFKNLVMGKIEEEVNEAVCSAVNELGDEDGALVFVIESNEQKVSYETDTVDASSSGVGWLVLFIALLILYSVSCCFLGTYCSGRLHCYKSPKSKTDNDTEEDNFSMNGSTSNNKVEETKANSLECESLKHTTDKEDETNNTIL